MVSSDDAQLAVKVRAVEADEEERANWKLEERRASARHGCRELVVVVQVQVGVC